MRPARKGFIAARNTVEPSAQDEDQPTRTVLKPWRLAAARAALAAPAWLRYQAYKDPLVEAQIPHVIHLADLQQYDEAFALLRHIAAHFGRE
jgi:lipase chaperone LimK